MRMLVLLAAICVAGACSEESSEHGPGAAHFLSYSAEFERILQIVSDLDIGVRSVATSLVEGEVKIVASRSDGNVVRNSPYVESNRELWSLMTRTGVEVILLNGEADFFLLPNIYFNSIELGVEIVNGRLAETADVCEGP